MAGSIFFSGNISPANAPAEVSYNGGTSFIPLVFATVSSLQQATLANVPPGSYAAGQIIWRPVGYPAAAISNPGVVTVTAQTATALRLAVCIGDSITFGAQLGTDYAKLCYPSQLALIASNVYANTANKGFSGNTTAQLLARMSADITPGFALSGQSGIDTYTLAGVNDFGAGTAIADTITNLTNMVAAYKNAQVAGRDKNYILTMSATTGYFTTNGTAALDAAVTSKINDFNASIRANCTTWGFDGFIDTARILQLQSPADTNNTVDGLHWTAPNDVRVATAITAFRVNGIQPSGPILSNSSSTAAPATTTPPPTTPTYVENPTTAQLAFVNPTLLPQNSAKMITIAADANGARVQSTAYDGGVNNSASTTQALSPVTTNWVGEAEWVVEDLVDKVMGFAPGAVSLFGGITYGLYLSNGNVQYKNGGATGNATTGVSSFAGVKVGDVIRGTVTKTTILWSLNGVQQSTFTRTETQPLRACVSMQGDPTTGQSVTAFRWRAWQYQAPVA